MIRIAVALVTVACAVLAPAPDAHAQKPVSFTAQIIVASNPKTPGPRDPAISDTIVKALEPTFKFTQYKSLGTVSGSTPVGKTWSTSLKDTGLTLEATPRSVDGGTISVEVKILRGASPLVTSNLKLAPGGQVVVGGPTIDSGRIIVALTGR